MTIEIDLETVAKVWLVIAGIGDILIAIWVSRKLERFLRTRVGPWLKRGGGR